MKTLVSAAVLAAVTVFATAVGAFAEGKTHYLAIHVDDNDPQRMNMALNNAQNVHNHYAAQGDDVVIEIVTYGPGVNMLIPGKSPVEPRISTISMEMPNITFAACGNTLRAMSDRQGEEVALMDEAQVVPSGVVRLMELQQDGYAYIRP
jgi:intracellular sulfur oxidation DsrE/DsrF family protein